MATEPTGSGTPDDPWILTTPPGKSEFEAYRDPGANPPALVVQVGSTELRYHLRCIEDLHAMLKERGDWVALGNADEQKPVDPRKIDLPLDLRRVIDDHARKQAELDRLPDDRIGSGYHGLAGDDGRDRR